MNSSLIRLNVTLVQCGPHSVLVNQAGSQWRLIGANVVSAELEEALLAPVGAPGVPDDPVVAAATTVDVLIWLHCAVADDEDAVVDFVVCATAAEILLGYNA